MLLLLFGFLLLHFSSCEAVKQSGLEDAVKNDPQEMMVKSENGIGDKVEELLKRVERMEEAHTDEKLEAKNLEVENLQRQLEEMKVQFENLKSGSKQKLRRRWTKFSQRQLSKDCGTCPSRWFALISTTGRRQIQP